MYIVIMQLSTLVINYNILTNKQMKLQQKNQIQNVWLLMFGLCT